MGDKVITKEVLDNGGYAYICSGVAGSKFLDQLFGEETTVEIEGMRTSKDPFFCGKDGNKEVDQMDVRKSAHANFTVRAAKALLGTGNYSASDLAKMGVKVSDVGEVTYNKGAEGGGQTDKISDAQRKRLFAISKEAKVSEASLKSHLEARYKITSTSDILRKDYEAIVAWVQAGGIETIQQGRQPGEDD